MPRLLHMADLHLGASSGFLEGEKKEIRGREIEDAFHRAVSFASAPESHIHGVLIAGDLFDSMMVSEDLIRRVAGEFQRLKSASIPVVLVPGTHDSALYPGSVYRRSSLPGVTCLMDPNPCNPFTCRLGGEVFHFYGMDFHPLHTLSPVVFEKNHLPGIHVGLVHGSLMIEEHWSARREHIPLSLEMVARSGLDYLALGHYHNFSRHDLGDTVAVYPGTLEGRRWNEEGGRFLVVAEFDRSGRVTIEKIPHNCRTVSRVTLDLDREGIESADDVIRAVLTYGDRDRSGILRVTLSGCREFPLSPGEVMEAASDHFFHLEVEDNTTLADSSLIASLSREQSVRGLFVRRIMEAMKDGDSRQEKVYSFALSSALEMMRGDEPLEI